MAITTIGIIGLGRMGIGIATRLIQAGFQVHGFDVNAHTCAEAKQHGIVIYTSQLALVQSCQIVWLMVPAGTIVDQVLTAIHAGLRPGMIVVDGGNSHYRDSMRRANTLHDQGVAYVDCGTSGGIHGQEDGFCLMLGGPRPAFETIKPLLKAIAAPDGYAYIGPSGTGHYVKMIHNGIEYGLMQAYAEGFDLIKHGTFAKENLNLSEITRVWQHGSVIRSWLLQLAHEIFAKDQQLTDVSGYIAQGGTGKWTVHEAEQHNMLLPVIKTALGVREWSEQTGGNYATKVVALLRHAFGGHAVRSIKKNNTTK